MKWLLILALVVAAQAETGYDAWLRYGSASAAQPTVLLNARAELVRAGRQQNVALSVAPDLQNEPNGFRISSSAGNVRIEGGSDAGVLYGVFAYLRDPSRTNYKSNPIAPIRWVNQWDNLDGSIQRGYGGRSIFWETAHVRSDLTRVSDYGRLLASIGINGATINNVNADKRLLAAEYIPGDRPHRRCVSAVGRACGGVGGFRQSTDCWRAGYLRSPLFQGRGLVGGSRRRPL